MKHFILDTNILLQDPTVLAKSSQNTRILIPSPVLLQLDASASTNNIRRRTVDLVRESLNSGVHLLEAPSINALELLQLASTIGRGIDPTDLLIAESVLRYITTHPSDAENIFLVTEDMLLAQYARSREINILDLAGLNHALESAPITDTQLAETATSIVRSQGKQLIWIFFLGVFANLVINSIIDNVDLIISTLTIWGTAILLPSLGLVLYWTRSRWRLFYGLTELFLGFTVALHVLFPDFNYGELDATDLIRIIAGIYAMVRGLDNVGKGLRKYPRLAAKWSTWFPE